MKSNFQFHIHETILQYITFNNIALVFDETNSKLDFFAFFDFQIFWSPWAEEHLARRRVFRKSRATSGACNFRASGQNCTKPSPNESINSGLSFHEGFMRFRSLERKLQTPEVARLRDPHGAHPIVHTPATPQKNAPTLRSYTIARRVFMLRT